MASRKTFNLGEQLSRAIAREARRQGRAESAIAREAFEEYLTARSGSKLAGWVGRGRSDRPLDHERLHEELVEVLEARDADQQ